MENEQSYFRELQPGVTLQNGKYLIERVLGAGGFGITYYARHTSLGQHYAIKEFFIDGRCVRNTQRHTVNLQGIEPEMYEKYRKKFTEEAQTLAKFDHPNIVRVIDIFEENETSYIVMPFIKGTTLESLVEKNGPLEYGLAVNYIGQISNAVDYVHSRNILHRDIKPDNIMITADNHAILIDFGSAREFIQNKTQHQTSILTKGYAPIEQYSSNSRKGAYTDIYSLGAVFYFVLTGQKPMDATERLSETMSEPKQINPHVTEEVNRTILKAMQLKPEDRYQNIGEFMDDLVGKQKPPTIKDPQPPSKVKNIPTIQTSNQTPKEPPSSSKLITIVIAVIVLLIGCAGVLIWYLNQHNSEPVRVEDIQHLSKEYHKSCRKCNWKLNQADYYSHIDDFFEGIIILRDEIEDIEASAYFSDTIKVGSDTLFIKLCERLLAASDELKEKMDCEPNKSNTNPRWVTFNENKRKLDFWTEQLPKVRNALDFKLPSKPNSDSIEKSNDMVLVKKEVKPQKQVSEASSSNINTSRQPNNTDLSLCEALYQDAEKAFKQKDYGIAKTYYEQVVQECGEGYAKCAARIDACNTAIENAKAVQEDEVFVVAETMPEYPGGTTALFAYLKENVKYPVIAQENGIQGRVICQFVVNKDGSIADIEVVKSCGDPSLDNEAIRVIKSMPKWKPGKQHGNAVRVKYTIPVNFRLE